MALCLTLNLSSFSFDSGEIKDEIVKIRTDEFKEKVFLKNSILNNFLKNLLTDDFDSKPDTFFYIY